MTSIVDMYQTHRTSICSATSRDTMRLMHIVAVSRTFCFSAGNLDTSFAAASLPSRAITTDNKYPMSLFGGTRSHSSSVRARSASIRIISILTHPMRSFLNASCNGVSPLLSAIFGSAPDAMRVATHFSRSQTTAQCSGVFPRTSVIFGFAPATMSV